MASFLCRAALYKPRTENKKESRSSLFSALILN